MPRRLSIGVVCGAIAATLSVLHGAAGGPAIAAIVTKPGQRASYLAHATIWREPGLLSPADIRNGPQGIFPYTFDQATSDAGIRCTFVTPGRDLSGQSPKFECRSDEGHTLRLKYWDPDRGSGNREVFATVAATRLMWALGFSAVPVLPANVHCQACPENPMTGQGEGSERRYIGLIQIRLQQPVIVSGHTVEQGWSWRELDEAITALPRGEERTRQRTHFDALALLAVVMQHGDRKPEQQALYCDAPVEPTAGEVHAGNAGTGALLFERTHTPACPRAAVAIVDAGATFGGAGLLSSDSTAKMNFEAWRKKPVFANADRGTCRGHLTVSIAAGDDGEPDPMISEDGRRFLVEQLHRLTPDHVRALFEAARVDQLTDSRQKDTPDTDDWVAAFADKVRQVDAHTCQAAR